MGKVLYRKYRPKALSEIVGQEHITTTLHNALKTGKISHAYLFTGPKGVGKTSIARILAHEVNKLVYDEEASHLDIIEIDAASNRGIEEIRELRDKVHTAPTSAKYKVYIIDEVHMLTKQAFNALLKTLEEPPTHVIFILATTEAHKIPDTIISRTQRFTFKPVAHESIAEHLQSIAEKERINISEDALMLIAQHGDGSFRDSISLLDQASNSKTRLEHNDILMMLGIPPETATIELVDTLLVGSPRELIERLSQLYEQGFRAPAIAKQVAQNLRKLLLKNPAPTDPSMIAHWLYQLLEVPTAQDPESLLEILLLGANIASNPSPSPTTQPSSITQAPSKITHAKEIPSQPPNVPIKQTQSLPVEISSSGDEQLTDGDLWLQILNVMKKRHNTLYSVLRMASPTFESSTLMLRFEFAFHQKRINEDVNKRLLHEIISEITGKPLTISCLWEKNPTKPTRPIVAQKPTPKEAPDTSALDTISSIFGGSEVLES